ncbi:hypothetical protein DL93DRAFT_2093394 [Clavulina sp. PMI_390]|nr:hypothetical protein DL93DRAFT_2093394 [Clavulina sp. PMI_390]
MSASPSSSSEGPPQKRKRMSSAPSNDRASYHSSSHHPGDGPQPMEGSSGPAQASSYNGPKRGSRACTNCRRGKNRCEFEGDAPCKRCQLAGVKCIFEKPEKKATSGGAGASSDRVSQLEGQFVGMQGQMIGMQSTLERILHVIQTGGPSSSSNPSAPSSSTSSLFPSSHNGSSHANSLPVDSQLQPILSPNMMISNQHGPSTSPINGQHFYSPPTHTTGLRGATAPVRQHHHHHSQPQSAPPARRSFPPLPGFAPPPHKFATYGIVPSTAPSSDDESEDTLPRASLNAPIEALQGLANAAAEAAAASTFTQSRPQINMKRVEPIPVNAFPNVIDKGLVSETEARELYKIFFSGCHIFIPCFDPTSFDTFDSLKSRTPFCFDSILAVASKIRAGSGLPSETFHRCLEEAQGIARSTLFGPVVRKEAVQAMLLLAAWSTNGWLPSGHAMRMALDLSLHRALEKLAESIPSTSSVAHNSGTPESNASGRKRSEEEERDLVVSARIWLCLYWFDHQMSLGTGRPMVLRDDATIAHCRLLLKHPMTCPTDLRLVAQVELIAQKTQLYESLMVSLSGQGGHVNSNTLAFVRRANLALDKWWQEWDDLHSQTMEPDALMRKILVADLHYGKLWLICTVLRGASWDKLTFEQRELAFQAKEAATDVLNTFLSSPAFRTALRYAVHDSLVTAAFAGLFLLKVASLFRREVDFMAIIAQVEQLAQLFSDAAADRYALTLRLMIVNLRRKVGAVTTGTQTPVPPPAEIPQENPHHMLEFDGTQQLPPITLQDLDFSWPSDMMFSPANIPAWLQEASLADLSLPVNGSDGIFLPMGISSLWPGDTPAFQAW